MSDTPNEQVVFEEGEVKITNRRAVIGSKTYAMSNITSVSMGKQEASGCVPFGLMVISVPFLLVGFANGPERLWVIVGIVALGLGVLIFRGNKPTFVVQIGSSSGEMKALTSPDRARIERIVTAMNDAIASG